MSSKKSLVTTKDNILKEGINDTKTKSTAVKEAITPTIAKRDFETVNKTEIPQASRIKKINTSAINQTKVNHWINQGIIEELKEKTQ